MLEKLFKPYIECSILTVTKLPYYKNNFNLLLAAGPMISYNPKRFTCTQNTLKINNSESVFIFCLSKFFKCYFYWQ